MTVKFDAVLISLKVRFNEKQYILAYNLYIHCIYILYLLIYFGIKFVHTLYVQLYIRTKLYLCKKRF